VSDYRQQQEQEEEQLWIDLQMQSMRLESLTLLGDPHYQVEKDDKNDFC
jgi:hypothetical protein